MKCQNKTEIGGRGGGVGIVQFKAVFSTECYGEFIYIHIYKYTCILIHLTLFLLALCVYKATLGQGVGEEESFFFLFGKTRGNIRDTF